MAHFEEAFPNSGFDGTATPPWLTVGTGESKLVALVNGPNLVLKSRDEHIAGVGFHASSSSPNRRHFAISGGSSGPAFVEAFTPGRRVPDLRLAVRVKAPKTLTIALNYVKDDSLNETARNRSPQFLDDLVNALDVIFHKQANVTFTRTGPRLVEVRTTLFRIVREQPDVEDLRDKGEFTRLVLVGDPGADVNVFFMAWPWPKGKLPDKHPDQRPTQMFGAARTCICEDAMSDDQVKIALPHLIGRLYGCQVTHNDRQKNHLMFHSYAEGQNPIPGPYFPNDIFVPKDCSNRVNPG
jgi:hypothetical protein